MKSFMLHITTIVAVLALAGSLPAATVMLKIEPTGSPTAPPGESVPYRVLCRLVGSDYHGLATVGFDIETDTGRTQQAATTGSAMDPFVDPNGLTNLAGFGGQAVDDDIRGIGGAQNTIDNDAGDPANPASPDGEVAAGIGLPAWVVVASGEILLPTQEATYTVNLANAFAGVLTTSSGPIWPVAEATVVLEADSFEITVSSTAPRVFAGLDRDAFEGVAVALHATASSPQNQPLQNPLFDWQQLTGLAVTLAGDDTADATFTAPLVSYVEEAAMSFRVTASDGAGPASSDAVKVRVYIAGDCSLDDNVDVVDTITMGDAMGYSLGDPEFNSLCDFNADNTVDVADLLILVDNFGRSLTSQSGQQMTAGGMGEQSQMTTSGPASESALQAVPSAGGMTVYEALEYAGLLNLYLDYIAEHPEAARSW